MTIDLALGRYRLRVSTDSPQLCLNWPLQPYEPFLTAKPGTPDLEFHVQVVKHLPDLSGRELIFDSCHGLWRLFHTKHGIVLEALDTKTHDPRSRSLISTDYSRVDVWLREKRQMRKSGWLPMHVLNPIAEVCFLTRLGREGGFLLHGASVILAKEGWVFTGHSGAGKSTMSGILAAQGVSVLSDERTILQKIGDDFHIFGTPWVGASSYAANRSGPLTSVFCLRHGQGTHCLTPMTSTALTRFLLQQAFLPHWDRDALQGALTAIGTLSECVEAADLAFLKNPNVFKFLRAYRRTRTVGAA